MKDYRLIVKVRNARLLRAIEAAGFTSIPQFAALIGVNYTSLNDLLNMTCSPLDAHGEIRGWVEKIIVYLDKPFDELFTEKQCEALTTNKSQRDVDAETLFALLSDDKSADDPSKQIEDAQLPEVIDDIFNALNRQELLVIKERYGMNAEGREKTLDEIGPLLDVGRERIRQIEAKAMRKLRNRCSDLNSKGYEREFASPFEVARKRIINLSAQKESS